MAQLQTTIQVDMAGMQPMFASMASLVDALNTADRCGEVEVFTEKDGLTFQGNVIARTSFTMKGHVAFMVAMPTFYMPAFCVDVCRQAPSIKVSWCNGWPQFSASDGDDDEPQEPGPVAPEKLVLA